VDIDPERVAAADPQIRRYLRVIHPDQPLPFPDDAFDTVVILEVIEHVRDDREVLWELARVLAPGGRLLLTTPHKGLLTFLDPGNVKFVVPRLHQFLHCTVMRRADYYESRFGSARRAGQGMVADFTLDQTPWHRHYRLADIRSKVPVEMEPVAWAVYFPAFRALWSLRLFLNVLTLGRVRDLPAPLNAAHRRLSRCENRWGDQLVVLFEKRRAA
jgi:SAM-dependent methyltransferase